MGNMLLSIDDQRRSVMDADNFCDDMLSFLFLRYLSENYGLGLPLLPVAGSDSKK